MARHVRILPEGKRANACMMAMSAVLSHDVRTGACQAVQ